MIAASTIARCALAIVGIRRADATVDNFALWATRFRRALYAYRLPKALEMARPNSADG